MRSPVADALAELDAVFKRLSVRYYLFGAQAALLHGAARLTADIDITVGLGKLPTADLADALRAAGFTLRVADPAFVDRTRVLPVFHGPSGIPVDVVLAGPGLEDLFFSRVETRAVEGVNIQVACAEDLIAMKILAGRTKDLEDVRAIVAARGSGLDLEVVRATLGLLEQALDRRDLLPELERVVARV